MNIERCHSLCHPRVANVWGIALPREYCCKVVPFTDFAIITPKKPPEGPFKAQLTPLGGGGRGEKKKKKKKTTEKK